MKKSKLIVMRKNVTEEKMLKQTSQQVNTLFENQVKNTTMVAVWGWVDSEGGGGDYLETNTLIGGHSQTSIYAARIYVRERFWSGRIQVNPF